MAAVGQAADGAAARRPSKTQHGAAPLAAKGLDRLLQITVEAATDASLPASDEEKNEQVRQLAAVGKTQPCLLDDLVAAINRRLLEKNVKVALLTVDLLENLSQNLDMPFIAALAMGPILQTMSDLFKKLRFSQRDKLSADHEQLKEKILRLLHQWKRAFRAQKKIPPFNAFNAAYKSLLHAGVQFPEPGPLPLYICLLSNGKMPVDIRDDDDDAEDGAENAHEDQGGAGLKPNGSSAQGARRPSKSLVPEFPPIERPSSLERSITPVSDTDGAEKQRRPSKLAPLKNRLAVPSSDAPSALNVPKSAESTATHNTSTPVSNMTLLADARSHISVQIEPSCLGFAVKFDEPARTSQKLRITNNSKAPIAYKILTNAPNHHVIKPYTGFLAESGGQDIDVSLMGTFPAGVCGHKLKIRISSVSRDVVNANDSKGFWKNGNPVFSEAVVLCKWI